MTSFSDADIDQLVTLVGEAGKREIMPRFRRLDDGDIRRKTSPVDLVTEGDLKAEEFLTGELHERFPGALVVGEEAVSKDATRLQGIAEADLAFVIDPIDGTFNFASGIPLFGVMLAVVAKGETVAGIIHDPVGGDWLIGAKGGGTHLLSSDGRRTAVKVADALPLSEMTGGVAWQFLDEPERSTLARNHAKACTQVGYRCAAYEYRVLATGHAHFQVHTKLMPWDHLAGALIHAEAGGYSARLDGSAYLPSHTEGGLLVAPDRESWQMLRRELWAE